MGVASKRFLTAFSPESNQMVDSATRRCGPRRRSTRECETYKYMVSVAKCHGGIESIETSDCSLVFFEYVFL